MAGYPDKAVEICQRGLKGDKKYPVFYYTMACICAQKGDGGPALEYIRQAYKYKDKMLPGESLANPLKHESFKELLKSEEFRQELERIVQ
ncbi:MAG: hypothetical protein GYA46_08775 [candidate division Zixibacteria bacterium]|nr:hypothetical protein [candidate division Zixibacteria bacterium]